MTGNVDEPGTSPRVSEDLESVVKGPTSSDDDWSTPSYRAADTRSGAAVPTSEWSTPTRTQSAPEQRTATTDRRVGRAFDDRLRGRSGDQAPAGAAGEDWSRGGPTSGRDQRATRLADRRAEADARRTERSVEALRERTMPREERPYERGFAWWWALAILVAITLAGALIDSIASTANQDAFNIAIVVGSIVGVLVVKRSQIFAIVVSPPIVYALAALLQLYLKKSLSQDKHGALNAVINAVQNYLVYGFPALATATAAVLIIAGIRLVARR